MTHTSKNFVGMYVTFSDGRKSVDMKFDIPTTTLATKLAKEIKKSSFVKKVSLYRKSGKAREIK